MNRVKRISCDDFFYGNFGNDNIPKGIIEQLIHHNPKLEPSQVIQDDLGTKTDNIQKRDCFTGWLHITTLPLITEALERIIQDANERIWNLPLKHEWESGLQVTRYSQPGHHFTWHPDTHRGEYGEEDIHKRVISVVYSLSSLDQYEGGEFDIKGENYESTFRFDLGDYIVFPSTLWHRVRPLVGGKRDTLVGWYR